jgi:hypothetical protein
MTIKAKKGFRNLITNTKLEAKGRKGIFSRYGVPSGDRARSPLTAQLYATLEHPDSYVRIPLEGRARSTMVSNLRMKAASVKAKLGTVHDPQEDVLYAWLEGRNGGDAARAV